MGPPRNQTRNPQSPSNRGLPQCWETNFLPGDLWDRQSSRQKLEYIFNCIDMKTKQQFVEFS